MNYTSKQAKDMLEKKLPTIKQLLEVMETTKIPLEGLKVKDEFRIDIDVVMKAFAKAIRKYLKERV